MMKTLTVFIFILSFTQLLVAGNDIEGNMEMFWGPIPPGKTIQDMTDQEKAQANINLENAVSPLLDMFGFISGGGLYNTADVHGALGFDFGIKLTAMKVGDDQLPNLTGLSSDYAKGPLSAEDGSFIPVPMIHAAVGLTGRLEIIGRFFTLPMGKDQSANGNITLVGVGAKYGLIQMFGLPKIAVVGAYHYLDMPEDFSFQAVNNLSGAIVASYSFPTLATVYGSIGVDYTKLTIDFNDPLPDPDTFSKHNLRSLIGVRITPIPLFPLFINVDYNFGDVKGVSAGAGISFR